MRTKLRALLRDRRNAAHVCTRHGQRAEARAGAGSGVQHRIAVAHVQRMGQTQASPGAHEAAAGAPIFRIRDLYRVHRGLGLARTPPLTTISGTKRYTGLASRSPIEGFPLRAASVPDQFTDRLRDPTCPRSARVLVGQQQEDRTINRSAAYAGSPFRISRTGDVRTIPRTGCQNSILNSRPMNRSFRIDVPQIDP